MLVRNRLVLPELDSLHFSVRQIVIALVWFEIAVIGLSSGGMNEWLPYWWGTVTLVFACMWSAAVGEATRRILTPSPPPNRSRLIAIALFPLALLALFAETRVHAARDIRFLLSEPSLNRAASQDADSSYFTAYSGRLIGSYVVTKIGDFWDCRHFTTDRIGIFSEAGFAYCPEGAPTAEERHFSPNLRYEHQHGDWFRFEFRD